MPWLILNDKRARDKWHPEKLGTREKESRRERERQSQRGNEEKLCIASASIVNMSCLINSSALNWLKCCAHMLSEFWSGHPATGAHMNWCNKRRALTIIIRWENCPYFPSPYTGASVVALIILCCILWLRKRSASNCHTFVCHSLAVCWFDCNNVVPLSACLW